MDFASSLASESVKAQLAAAMFLRFEGAAGEPHIARLLGCCMAIDLCNEQLDKYEESLLGFGAMTMGDIVRHVGFNDRNPLHFQILNWIVALTDSRNLTIAGYSIWGVGLLEARHPIAIDCLTRIVESKLRESEHGVVTLRSLALRMLSRVDLELAVAYKSSQAWVELRRAMNWWQKTDPDEKLQTELWWLNESC